MSLSCCYIAPSWLIWHSLATLSKVWHGTHWSSLFWNGGRRAANGMLLIGTRCEYLGGDERCDRGCWRLIYRASIYAPRVWARTSGFDCVPVRGVEMRKSTRWIEWLWYLLGQCDDRRCAIGMNVIWWPTGLGGRGGVGGWGDCPIRANTFQLLFFCRRMNVRR